MNKTNDFLLEIGCEEIPTGFILPALDRMKFLFESFCKEQRITHGEVNTYATPRRLVILAKAVAQKQADVTIEVKGPPAAIAKDADGNWTKAAEKFAQSRGASPSDLVIRETEKGAYTFVVRKEKGVASSKALVTLPQHLVEHINSPKNMKWDVRQIKFARPVRWVLFLLGDKTAKAGFDGIPCGRYTYGNRYFGTKNIKINSIDDYFTKLEDAGVMVDHNRRMNAIREGVLKAANGRPHLTDALLEEVTFLVEYPYISVGSFADEFTKLPPEVLIICIEKNQHYFPIFDENSGKVLPRFVNVMNVPLTDSAVSKSGFEKVLLSRLKDAKFFYDEDVKIPLPDRVKTLDRITFQQQLGSLMDKTSRVQTLVAKLGKVFELTATEIEAAKRAALLMKADLGTQMVFEYTEIQGSVGKYYALHAGEPEDVAQAIEEHYMPRFADDDLPASRAGAALAISDKLDTITGYFAVGLIPSGSADPFQLRRQALGVMRILENLKFTISLPEILRTALGMFSEEIISPEKIDDTVSSLMAFFRIRYTNYMESQGFDYDVVNAVDLATVPGLHEARRLCEALAKTRNTAEFKSLHEVFTRVSNIQKKSAGSGDFKAEETDPAMLEEQDEKNLYEAFTSVNEKLSTAPNMGYDEKIQQLFNLTKPANSFFDNVMVMAKDPQIRSNRLALLKQIRDLYIKVAQFNEIVVQKD